MYNIKHSHRQKASLKLLLDPSPETRSRGCFSECGLYNGRLRRRSRAGWGWLSSARSFRRASDFNVFGLRIEVFTVAGHASGRGSSKPGLGPGSSHGQAGPRPRGCDRIRVKLRSASPSTVSQGPLLSSRPLSLLCHRLRTSTASAYRIHRRPIPLSSTPTTTQLSPCSPMLLSMSTSNTSSSSATPTTAAQPSAPSSPSPRPPLLHPRTL